MTHNASPLEKPNCNHDRAQLAAAAINVFCPVGNKEKYRGNAFMDFIWDYDHLPYFTLEHGLSELKSSGYVAARLQNAKMDCKSENMFELGLLQIHHRLGTIETVAKDHRGLSGVQNIRLSKMAKELAEANRSLKATQKELQATKDELIKSKKTARRRFWAGAALSVTGIVIGAAIKFGAFDKVEKKVEDLFRDGPQKEHTLKEQPSPTLPLTGEVQRFALPPVRSLRKDRAMTSLFC
ncbi:MAG: hypothetical protein WC612_03140 [Bdellovibrionales bacterium]